MEFSSDLLGLIDKIQSIHEELMSSAIRSVNTMLTLRNWMIGYHISNYELQGADRAQYGDRLIEKISVELQRFKVPRSTKRELHKSCHFYRTHPQIGSSLNAQSGLDTLNIPKMKDAEIVTHPITPPKVRSLNAQLLKLGNKLVNNLSYAYFEILVMIDDELYL